MDKDELDIILKISWLECYIKECSLPRFFSWLGLYGHREHIEKAKKSLKELKDEYEKNNSKT